LTAHRHRSPALRHPPVTYPAYPQTTSAVRSFRRHPIDEHTALAYERARRRLPLTDDDRMLLSATADMLNALLLTDPAQSSHSDTPGSDPAPSGHSVLRRESPVPIDAMRAQRLRARLDRMAKL
jgi:hypothetical protein